ncbi:MAG: Gfo/Idh/MocA family oxidoreductase [Puniceicoccales bacterium]|nr:Gfo/Idh/MocA family oxidoreductase [Puniceicoccales bacterium]
MPTGGMFANYSPGAKIFSSPAAPPLALPSRAAASWEQHAASACLPLPSHTSTIQHFTTHFTMSYTTLPRRSFIKSLLAAGAFPFVASSVPALFGAPAKKAKAPGQKVRVACIGIGNQGAGDVGQFDRSGLAEIVALCDTELKDPQGSKRIQGVLRKHPKAARFSDFRELFDKAGKTFDAVLIATPDFSHFPAAILAMSQGKHVYVEKPVAHTFDQVELLLAAEKKYKVVTQMGNQGHSGANYFQFREWAGAGIIKNITRINAHMNSSRRWHWSIKPRWRNLDGFLPKKEIPAWLDWNAWLATATEHDFNPGYLAGEWRSWFDFGNGAIGDWGAHIFDTAHEFLNLGLPTEVVPLKLEGANPFVFPQASTLQFKFAARGKDQPALDLFWFDGQKNIPPLPSGGGAIEVDASIPTSGGGSNKKDTKAPSPGKEIYSADGLVFQGGSHASTLKILDKEKAAALKLPPVPKSPSDHYSNFLLSVLGKEKPRSPFSVSGPLCQMMALGIIAQRVGKVGEKISFDAKTKRITNNKVADELLTHKAPRTGWEQFYTL